MAMFDSWRTTVSGRKLDQMMAERREPNFEWPTERQPGTAPIREPAHSH
jgi:hypothetical protein